MSSKFFKILLLVDNLLLIILTILGISLNIVLTGTHLLIDFNVLMFSYIATSFLFVLASFCFIGIVYSHSVCLHFTAALILCAPFAFSVWLVVKEFLFSQQINYYIVGVSIVYGFLWFVQIIGELCLGCYLCCQPGSFKETDNEKGEMKELGNEMGTDEERERLVAGKEPPNRTTSLKGLKASESCPEEEDDMISEDKQDMVGGIGYHQKLGDSGARYHDMRLIDDDNEITASPPGMKTDRAVEHTLETLPEENERLLPNSECPLASPEDI